MSLLVPDYMSCSSEDDEQPSYSVPSSVSETSCSQRNDSQSFSNASNDASAGMSEQKPMNTKKTKTKSKRTLYLPPEIQRLLETGKSSGVYSDSTDEDSELLAKHKQVKKAANKRVRPTTSDRDSVLSFLPLPKHELPVLNGSATADKVVLENRQEKSVIQDVRGAHTDQPLKVEEAAASSQQYYQQQQQYQSNDTAISHDYYVAQGENDVSGGSSKRRRMRERDIERALQDGHFETVAEQITEVHGSLPNAWQLRTDPLIGDSRSSEQQVKVKASFWNAQAGTMVSSVKPSRLQRQKHQLNQLAFDAKARDFELLDKRSASLKTKRETYAKYGW